MSWNLWSSATAELPARAEAFDDDDGRPGDVDATHVGHDDVRDAELQNPSVGVGHIEAAAIDGIAVQAASDTLRIDEITTDAETSGCWHVRPVAAREPSRVTPMVRRDASPRRQTLAEQTDLAGIGVPEHLIPQRGGVFALLDLLERAPSPRLPSMRPGDEVVVVTVEPLSGHAGSHVGLTDVVDGVTRCLWGHGAATDPSHVRVFAWPTSNEPDQNAAEELALVNQVRSLRARVELLAIHPDCPGTVAYPACRAVPSAQLYLTGVRGAARPAAPLGWGAPIAFVDGRRSSPAVLAAIFADRLAGGVS